MWGVYGCDIFRRFAAGFSKIFRRKYGSSIQNSKFSLLGSKLKKQNTFVSCTSSHSVSIKSASRDLRPRDWKLNNCWWTPLIMVTNGSILSMPCCSSFVFTIFAAEKFRRIQMAEAETHTPSIQVDNVTEGKINVEISSCGLTFETVLFFIFCKDLTHANWGGGPHTDTQIFENVEYSKRLGRD